MPPRRGSASGRRSSCPGSPKRSILSVHFAYTFVGSSSAIPEGALNHLSVPGRRIPLFGPTALPCDLIFVNSARRPTWSVCPTHRWGSERNPQPELYASRLFLTGGLSKQSAREVRGRLVQIYTIETIEQVENLTADFERGAFLAEEPGIVHGFDRVQIDLRKTRPFECVPA